MDEKTRKLMLKNKRFRKLQREYFRQGLKQK